MLRELAINLLRSKIVRSKTFTGLNGPYLTIYTLVRIGSLSVCVHLLFLPVLVRVAAHSLFDDLCEQTKAIDVIFENELLSPGFNDL